MRLRILAFVETVASQRVPASLFLFFEGIRPRVGEDERMAGEAPKQTALIDYRIEGQDIAINVTTNPLSPTSASF